MAINSHIQITRSILKNFKHSQTISYKNKISKKDSVWCLNINADTIEELSIKKAGTALGYYSDEAENYLSRYVETPFGDALKKIIDFEQEKSNCYLSVSNIEAIKKFFLFSIIRSQYFHKKVNDYSIFKDVFGEIPHEKLIYEASQGNYDKNIDFSKFYISILANKSSSNFIVPMNCIYAENCLLKGFNYIMPVSSKTAIVLKSIDINYNIINDEKMIWYLNILAAVSEYKSNNKFIFSEHEKELVMIKKYVPKTINNKLSNIELNQKIENIIKDMNS